MNPFALIPAGFAALVALSVVFGSFYTVDEGERGVMLRNGAVVGTAGPGLGFKMPMIDSVVSVSVQSQSMVFEQEPAYSRDQQPAFIGFSVNYRADPSQVETIYSSYGGLEGLSSRVVIRQAREELKNVFGRFNAVTAVTERERLNQEVFEALNKAITGPVVLESVQIENIDFSDAYEESVEQRMLAEVEVDKLRQNADREKVQAEIVVTQAQAQADAVRAQAEAQADAIRLKGEAEAEAIDARGKALRDNPMLVDLVQAERWDGVLPTTMVPGSTVPFMNMPAAAGTAVARN